METKLLQPDTIALQDRPNQGKNWEYS